MKHCHYRSFQPRTLRVGFRVEGILEGGLHRGYIGIMEKKMETSIL